MYLTKLPRIEGDAYKQHQYVRSIFEGDQRVLFQQADNILFILSDLESTKVNSEKIDLSKYKNGDRILFTIRINPTMRISKTRKRIGLSPTQTKKWIQRKFEEAGIKAEGKTIIEGTNISNYQDTIISIFSVFYYGYLTIEDIILFRYALHKGIGPAKGFGFGMLNIFI